MNPQATLPQALGASFGHRRRPHDAAASGPSLMGVL